MIKPTDAYQHASVTRYHSPNFVSSEDLSVIKLARVYNLHFFLEALMLPFWHKNFPSAVHCLMPPFLPEHGLFCAITLVESMSNSAIVKIFIITPLKIKARIIEMCVNKLKLNARFRKIIFSKVSQRNFIFYDHSIPLQYL